MTTTIDRPITAPATAAKCKLRVGDVIAMVSGKLVVVVGMRHHSIVGKIEAVCQPILRDMDGVFLVFWRNGGHANVCGRNYAIAANVLDRMARNKRRHADLCKLERTRELYLADARRCLARAARLRRLTHCSQSSGTRDGNHGKNRS